MARWRPPRGSHGSDDSRTSRGPAARCRSWSWRLTRTVPSRRRCSVPKPSWVPRPRGGRTRRSDAPRRRAGDGRGPRHDRGPALAGPHDLGRPGDHHLAHRGPRAGRATTLLRPAWQGEPGWPVLLPTAQLAALAAVAPTRMPPDVIEDLAAAIPSRVVEVGRSRASPMTSTRPAATCPRTRARRIRRPGTPTNGAPTSPPRPA